MVRARLHASSLVANLAAYTHVQGATLPRAACGCVRSYAALLAPDHAHPHTGLCHFQSTNMKCAQKFVAPAGYLGSSFWGCAILIACAWYPRGPRVAAITLLVFLVVALALTLVGTVAKKV